MQSVPREWLDFLRQQFPKDSRIQLTEIGGNPRPISPGSTGKLDYIDDAGQFHVKWDNGCTLALVLGEDRFSVYLPEPQTFKLYMPLTADFYGRDEWGDMSEDGEEWDGHTLMDYEGQILSALVKNRVPEENESGLMRWYGEDDSVDHKVRSAVFTVEVRNRQLWGVAECRVAGELTPEELTILKEYLGGQASDGWGEGFEQRPIEVDGGELYVHLWQPDDWSIQTEQERFAPKVAEGLPELCFSTLRTTGQLICIKRGETGYYPSDWDTGDKEGNVELADELNEDLGVTPIQRQAIGKAGAPERLCNAPEIERLAEGFAFRKFDEGMVSKMAERVYCLYRGKDQESILMQKNTCYDFVEKKGWNIVGEEQEIGVSGYKVSADDRVKLQRIRKAAEQGEFDILLVFMYDRLGRNLNETPFIAEWFTKKGIHVWSVYEGEIIDGVDAERMLDYIRFWQTDEAQKL